ncbi:PREDICTED: uncharacterized protein LOC109114099 [Nelumbo nucifera]|uniref:Uncharacterized protein LOC109114099 n=1 Tax=Nelumbo nucifera TaxID=4432 RepID=A0A1U8Q146_NELNU|nr:PREDICTED: uncharacterized protein LOC109114099 [Nelumbo nucifera]
MATLFHDIIHRELKVYVDDIIAKSKKVENHLKDLRKLFERLRKFCLKLNPQKCIFGASSGMLLGFIVSQKGIEIDPAKVKAIIGISPPQAEKEVISFLGRLQYILRFIAQLTPICEPIFKLLKKNTSVKWNEDCQEAFDKIKEYLTNPPVLAPPSLGEPLLMYLSVQEDFVGCILG